MMGMGMGRMGMTMPIIIASVVMFFAGNQLWGSYRVDKARKECSEIRNQIIENAIQQARDLAEQFEQENARARELQRRIDGLEAEQRETEQAAERRINEFEEALIAATESLKACQLGQPAAEILNDWELSNDETDDSDS